MSFMEDAKKAAAIAKAVGTIGISVCGATNAGSPGNNYTDYGNWSRVSISREMSSANDPEYSRKDWSSQSR